MTSNQSTPGGRPLVPGTASWGRRVVALLLDWAACYGVAAFIQGGIDSSSFGFTVLGVFWIESSLGVALTGASFGQLLARIRVRRLDGRPLGLMSALGRQLLICVVVPPLVFRADGRGLHDILSDSAAFPLSPATEPGH